MNQRRISIIGAGISASGLISAMAAMSMDVGSVIPFRSYGHDLEQGWPQLRFQHDPQSLRSRSPGSRQRKRRQLARRTGR